MEASAKKSSMKKSSKKRRAPEIDDSQLTENVIAHDKGEDTDGIQIDDNDPTMADKLASLGIEKNDNTEIQESPEPSQTQPPSADSIHVLLRQALHADDSALLLDCLYNQDDKVIANSVSHLNAVDIFKLLNSLLAIIQSRGAVLVCALPWLRSLLLQHSSRIMSQETSLAALNSLYQLIESRVANFNHSLQLASSLDLLHAGVADEGVDEYDSGPPVIYEDKDESEEEESEEDAMDTDEENKEPEDFSGISDADLSEGFSD
ncbi:WD repeat-containing protein 43-like [Chenopodium quinoa]|uniref:WD repeat-containing protein 43-like n=1 Tax=Chenopodium quinoa TaxID=63459 RepID=UPI000B78099D|nr:WD repeat-containing protein 43-like [Chenopodium quinoa]